MMSIYLRDASSRVVGTLSKLAVLAPLDSQLNRSNGKTCKNINGIEYLTRFGSKTL